MTAEHTSVAERRLGGQHGTMIDFWQWAFSDLRANNVRGIFAEWMVAQILEAHLPPRDSWASHDVALSDGRTIEVKAAAYLQAWHDERSRPSIIQFGGLKSHRWIDSEQRWDTNPKTYNADLYVFCVQTELDRLRWDVLDLNQWDFYVLPRSELEHRGTSTLRLSVVQSRSKRLSADELRGRIGVVGSKAAEASVETCEAIEELERGDGKSFASVEELIEDLNTTE